MSLLIKFIGQVYGSNLTVFLTVRV